MASLRVTRILADLTRVADGPAVVSGQGLPQRLVADCAAMLPITGVGMILMTDAGPAGVVAASDGPATVLEELQFTVGVGPCVDASRTGRPILIDDLASTGDQRWPAFAAGALEAGVAAVFAYPLRVGAIRLGVLDLYRDQPGPLSEDTQQTALDFADAATAVLLHLQAESPRDGDGSALVTVIEDRSQLHQATGIVAVQADVDLASALVLLRARAFAVGRPVLELARDVLARQVTFTAVADEDPS